MSPGGQLLFARHAGQGSLAHWVLGSALDIPADMPVVTCCFLLRFCLLLHDSQEFMVATIEKNAQWQQEVLNQAALLSGLGCEQLLKMAAVCQGSTLGCAYPALRSVAYN